MPISQTRVGFGACLPTHDPRVTFGPVLGRASPHLHLFARKGAGCGGKRSYDLQQWAQPIKTKKKNKPADLASAWRPSTMVPNNGICLFFECNGRCCRNGLLPTATVGRKCSIVPKRCTPTRAPRAFTPCQQPLHSCLPSAVPQEPGRRQAKYSSINGPVSRVWRQQIGTFVDLPPTTLPHDQGWCLNVPHRQVRLHARMGTDAARLRT
jgi:hypothetical protein